MEKSPNDIKNIVNAVIIMAIIAVFFILAITAKKNDNPEDSARHAFIISQFFVEQKLKSPSTADFPLYEYNAIELEKNRWQVISYVDAQNSFGATIRTNYLVIMKYNGLDWDDINNWKLDEIIIE